MTFWFTYLCFFRLFFTEIQLFCCYNKAGTSPIHAKSKTICPLYRKSFHLFDWCQNVYVLYMRVCLFFFSSSKMWITNRNQESHIRIMPIDIVIACIPCFPQKLYILLLYKNTNKTNPHHSSFRWWSQIWSEKDHLKPGEYFILYFFFLLRVEQLFA